MVRGKLQVSSSSCDASGVSCSCGGEVEGLLKAKAVNQVDAIGGGKGGGAGGGGGREEKEAEEENFSPTPAPITGRYPREMLHKLLYRY